MKFQDGPAAVTDAGKPPPVDLTDNAEPPNPDSLFATPLSTEPIAFRKAPNDEKANRGRTSIGSQKTYHANGRSGDLLG